MSGLYLLLMNQRDMSETQSLDQPHLMICTRFFLALVV